MIIIIPLFLISFIAIIVIFSKRLSLVQSQNISIIGKEETRKEIPYVLEVKHFTVKRLKKYGYLVLVTTIRLYFRSLNFLKRKYKKLKRKIDNSNKSEIKNGIEKKEMNGFLKGISDYKNKIRRIKHEIKEEENKM